MALHWPCVTDNSGLSTYGLNGLRKGDEHPIYAPSEYGPPLPYLTQTMSHIVESCPLTKLNGSLSRQHSADEDAVSWLTSYG